MNPTVIFTGYLKWHYTKAFVDIYIVCSNLFWFIVHFFSIKLLITTLFSPWRRIHENYDKKSFEGFFGSLLVNILSRIIGACVRLSIVTIGLVTLVIGIVGVVCFIVFWIGAPLILALLIITGVQYFI